MLQTFSDLSDYLCHHSCWLSLRADNCITFDTKWKPLYPILSYSFWINPYLFCIINPCLSPKYIPEHLHMSKSLHFYFKNKNSTLACQTTSYFSLLREPSFPKYSSVPAISTLSPSTLPSTLHHLVIMSCPIISLELLLSSVPMTLSPNPKRSFSPFLRSVLNSV